MSKDEVKSQEVLDAEKNGGTTFDPTEASDNGNKCSDCNGDGVRSPEATQVCSTCQGTGKV